MYASVMIKEAQSYVMAIVNLYRDTTLCRVWKLQSLHIKTAKVHSSLLDEMQ
jgi:hypothetical protein